MTVNPSNVALYGFLTQVRFAHTTTGSEIVVDRAQNIAPAYNTNPQSYWELGRKGKIGMNLPPPEFTISLQQMMTDNMELEYLCAGLIPSPGGAQSWNLGQILTNANKLKAYALIRNQDDTILGEQEYDGMALSSIEFTWAVGQAMTQTFTYLGRQGKFYTSGSAPHQSWGSLDDVSLGAIDGKDAVIYFSSGSSPTTDKVFRLQSFTIRVTFPSVHVRELGLRAHVGTLSDAADVSVDFEILTADAQPVDVLYTLTSGYYDYTNPKAAFNAYVRVFDPRLTEWLSVLKMFKIENVKAVSGAPLRSQVRGLSTSSYSLMVEKEGTADTGGLIVSNRNNL